VLKYWSVKYRDQIRVYWTWFKRLWRKRFSLWTPQAGREKHTHTPAAEQTHQLKTFKTFSLHIFAWDNQWQWCSWMYRWDFLVVSFPVSQSQNVSRLLHGACVCVCRCKLGDMHLKFMLWWGDPAVHVRISVFLLNQSKEEKRGL